MPGEVLPRSGDANAPSRLSSFGFSGTIAHALFVLVGAQSSTGRASASSLYRWGDASWPAKSSGRLVAPLLHAEVRDSHPALAAGTLAVLSHHVVGRSIMKAGVGYAELALTTDAGRRTVFSVVAQPSSLLEALWNSEGQRRKQRRVRIIITIASSLSSTSRTETRCLNCVKSKSMQEETGCRTHQLEVIFWGKQRWATNTSMRQVLLSSARAEASLRLTGDTAGSDALPAAALSRST